MQPRFGIKVLVLQPERLVRRSRYVGFFFQTTPAGVIAEPQEVAVLIGHLSWDAGAVVAVAAFDGGLAITRRYFGFAFSAFRQIIEGGDLPFQTT